MFVSESTLNFMGGTKLQILSPEGELWEGQIDPSATVDSLKRLAFQHFYSLDPDLTDATGVYNPENFRLMYPGESRTLTETHAIQEERLKENDMLMIIRRRTASPQEEIRNVDLKPPTAAEIAAATKDLPPCTKTSPQSSSAPAGRHFGAHGAFGAIGGANHDESNSETNVDFQLELRKILISLVSVMSELLSQDPDAELICQQMHARLKRRLLASRKPIEGSSFQYPEPPPVACTPMGIISGMAEAKKREFRPNAKAMESLREMGFSDEQIIEALRATKNSKDAACEWIIAGKTNPKDSDVGLDQNSHLFLALVHAPTIRLGLSNPKILLAFLNILDGCSSTAANVWLNDTDTSPVLSTIFKIYHAEKHAAPSDQPSTSTS